MIRFLQDHLWMFFLLLGSAVASSPNHEIIAAASAQNPCANIRNGQFVCLDCGTLAFCKQEAGAWVTTIIEKCSIEKSMFCNEDERSCQLQYKCFLPSQGVRFDCQNPGIYPDPYDCKYYHSCDSYNKDTRHMCPSGYAYSPAAKDCVGRIADSDQCRSAQYNCKKPGMMGAWPGDANIYYICDVKLVNGEMMFYPLLYRCQPNNIFDGQKCVASNGSDGIIGGNDIGSPIIDESMQCTANRLSAHPTDCRKYYSCNNGKKVLHECPANMGYNDRKSTCEWGAC